MYGLMMDILIVLWSNLTNYPLFKLVVAFVVFVVVQSSSEFITHRICRRMLLKYEDIYAVVRLSFSANKLRYISSA